MWSGSLDLMLLVQRLTQRLDPQTVPNPAGLSSLNQVPLIPPAAYGPAVTALQGSKQGQPDSGSRRSQIILAPLLWSSREEFPAKQKKHQLMPSGDFGTLILREPIMEL